LQSETQAEMTQGKSSMQSAEIIGAQWDVGGSGFNCVRSGGISVVASFLASGVELPSCVAAAKGSTEAQALQLQ
jgi:hypothetical protein